jgi:hypothetical protein
MFFISNGGRKREALYRWIRLQEIGQFIGKKKTTLYAERDEQQRLEFKEKSSFSASCEGSSMEKDLLGHTESVYSMIGGLTFH